MASDQIIHSAPPHLLILQAMLFGGLKQRPESQEHLSANFDSTKESLEGFWGSHLTFLPLSFTFPIYQIKICIYHPGRGVWSS